MRSWAKQETLWKLLQWIIQAADFTAPWQLHVPDMWASTVPEIRYTSFMVWEQRLSNCLPNSQCLFCFYNLFGSYWGFKHGILFMFSLIIREIFKHIQVGRKNGKTNPHMSIIQLQDVQFVHGQFGFIYTPPHLLLSPLWVILTQIPDIMTLYHKYLSLYLSRMSIVKHSFDAITPKIMNNDSLLIIIYPVSLQISHLCLLSVLFQLFLEIRIHVGFNHCHWLLGHLGLF